MKKKLTWGCRDRSLRFCTCQASSPTPSFSHGWREGGSWRTGESLGRKRRRDLLQLGLTNAKFISTYALRTLSINAGSRSFAFDSKMSVTYMSKFSFFRRAELTTAAKAICDKRDGEQPDQLNQTDILKDFRTLTVIASTHWYTVMSDWSN
jgi:hypothetical protein